MTDKVLGTGLETELFVDKFHAVRIEVDAWVVYGEFSYKIAGGEGANVP